MRRLQEEGMRGLAEIDQQQGSFGGAMLQQYQQLVGRIKQLEARYSRMMGGQLSGGEYSAQPFFPGDGN